jgi:RNA polymerase sigma-70 factor (ECF subfamily)
MCDFLEIQANHVIVSATTRPISRLDARGLGELQARFESYLARHKGIVFKVANTYCRDPEDQRDLAQEIRVQLWRAFRSFDDTRSFSTWMYRIALNVAISYRRSASFRHRHVQTLDDQALAALPDRATNEPDDRVRELYRVIDQLDDLHRALVLLYLEGRGYGEMADVLGITETNVATKLNRLRSRLKRALND